MKYDFNKVINRKDIASYKWNGTKFIVDRSATLSMRTADMKLSIARPAIDATKQ